MCDSPTALKRIPVVDGAGNYLGIVSDGCAKRLLHDGKARSRHNYVELIQCDSKPQPLGGTTPVPKISSIYDRPALIPKDKPSAILVQASREQRIADTLGVVSTYQGFQAEREEQRARLLREQQHLFDQFAREHGVRIQIAEVKHA